MIAALPRLETLHCDACRALGPILGTGTLPFRSKTLKTVRLRGCGISTVQPGAITGTKPMRKLKSQRNSNIYTIIVYANFL